MLGVAAALLLMVGAGVLTWKAVGSAGAASIPAARTSTAAAAADDGFVLEARGRQVSRLRLYEDRDGSRHAVLGRSRPVRARGGARARR